MAEHQQRCMRCDIELATYPQHVYYATDTGQKILGSKMAMCEGIFHVFKAQEFQIPTHASLNGFTRDECKVRAMTLVVVCGNITARFTNCNRKHAEEFFVCEERIKRYVRTFRPKAITMLMKHHPCHHSSGNSKKYADGYLFDGVADKKSCTNAILRYYRECLKPFGTRLIIKVAWLYKAFWAFAERTDDIVTSKNSLKGLELLIEAGIEVEAMLKRDWILLANMCTDKIPLEVLFCEQRMKADFGNKCFLDKVKLSIELRSQNLELEHLQAEGPEDTEQDENREGGKRLCLDQ